MPLAAASAYVSARVVSTRRWARALAALAWATSPVAAAALSGGRLAALAALVLMPLLGAGLIHLTAPRSRFAVVPATALVAAALAAVLPGTLVLVGLAGVAALIAGTSRVRGRAAGLIALTATAAAPTVLACWERPVRLHRLGPARHRGCGRLAVAGCAAGAPCLRRLACVCRGPAGPRRRPRADQGGRRPALAWGLAATALAGLAITLALPRVAVVVSAEGVDRTGWAGTGQLVMGLGLIGAALAGLEGLDLRALARRRGGLAAWPAVIVGTGASLGLAGLCAWTGFGTALRPALDPRPAVAIDQGTGPAASRSLLITSSENGIAYAVRGREPGLPARDLADQGSSTLLDGVVDDLLADAPRPGADPAARLGDWAIGFVVVNAPVAGAVSRHLDSMSGLSRIGDTATAEVWRVDPGVDVGALGSPSRARLLTGGSAATVPVTGSHGATRTAVTAPETALLLLAEPRGWADHGIVTADGKALPLVIRVDGRVAAQVPAGTTSLAIEVRPRHPVLAWTYLVLLALLAYLALPLGAPPRPAAQRPEPEPGAGTGRGPGQTSGGRTGSPSGEWTGAEHREGSATVSGEETGSVSGEAAEALSGEGTGVEHREGSGTAPGEGTTTAPGGRDRNGARRAGAGGAGMRRSTLDALARVAVAVTVAGGLLAAADRTNIRIDLAGSGAATTASRSLVTAVERPCPGTELGGVDGVEDLPTTAQVAAEAAPTQALGGLAARLPAAGSLIARDLSGATPRGVAATSREGRLTATLTTPDPLLVLGGGAPRRRGSERGVRSSTPTGCTG